MRDFKSEGSFSVAGDFVINDSSQHCKSLSEYNVEELGHEYHHREKLLKEERGRKKSKVNRLLVASFIIGFAIYFWYQTLGESNVLMYIAAIFGVLYPFFSAQKLSEKTTEFELRQLYAIKEISYLLREKS